MTIFGTWRRAALVGAMALILAGCGALGGDPKGNPNDPDRLYREARDDLNNGSYERAAKSLEKVEALATGTLLGQQAQLDQAYAQWRQGERTAALTVIDRFLRLNPSSPAYDYGLYLKGLINFNDNLGLFGSISGQRLAERDQKASRESYQTFRQLVEQFPESRYASDARLRMDYIVNMLAEHEVQVARYYFRRGAYLAAANRVRQALTEYDQVPVAEDALVLLVQSYDRLGLTALRDDAERVLKKNFPNSERLPDGSSRSSRPWWQLW